MSDRSIGKAMHDAQRIVAEQTADALHRESTRPPVSGEPTTRWTFDKDATIEESGGAKHVRFARLAEQEGEGS